MKPACTPARGSNAGREPAPQRRPPAISPARLSLHREPLTVYQPVAGTPLGMITAEVVRRRARHWPAGDGESPAPSASVARASGGRVTLLDGAPGDGAASAGRMGDLDTPGLAPR